MIKVERILATAAEAALNKVNRNGLTEREHAMWFFGGITPERDPLPPKPLRAPDFKAYREPAVKEALITIFGTKCAYCESPYSHINAMDVEHYRPKSAYLDDQGKLCKPGYYWLAATYENLLPSCGDCNRERKLFHRKKDGKLVKTKSGKANRFPVAPGTRATSLAQEQHERPMLLNPCNDEPDEHLRFSVDGFVEVALSPQEAALGKGRESIIVYGLIRNDLVSERKTWSLLTQAAMQRVLQADRNIRIYPSDTSLPDQLKDAETALAGFFTSISRYRAMTKVMQKTFEAVRSAVTAYFEAEAAWIESRRPAEREALIAFAEAICLIQRNTDLDCELSAVLLRSAELPKPMPAA